MFAFQRPNILKKLGKDLPDKAFCYFVFIEKLFVLKFIRIWANFSIFFSSISLCKIFKLFQIFLTKMDRLYHNLSFEISFV